MSILPSMSTVASGERVVEVLANELIADYRGVQLYRFNVFLSSILSRTGTKSLSFLVKQILDRLQNSLSKRYY